MPTIVQNEEQSEWLPYTGNETPQDKNLYQPSNVHSMYKGFCELSMIIHNTQYELYAGVRPLTTRAILDQYTAYLAWYDSLPAVLRLGENSTPSVFFTQ